MVNWFSRLSALLGAVLQMVSTAHAIERIRLTERQWASLAVGSDEVEHAALATADLFQVILVAGLRLAVVLCFFYFVICTLR